MGILPMNHGLEARATLNCTYRTIERGPVSRRAIRRMFGADETDAHRARFVTSLSQLFGMESDKML